MYYGGTGQGQEVLMRLRQDIEQTKFHEVVFVAPIDYLIYLISPLYQLYVRYLHPANWFSSILIDDENWLKWHVDDLWSQQLFSSWRWSAFLLYFEKTPIKTTFMAISRWLIATWHVSGWWELLGMLIVPVFSCTPLWTFIPQCNL